MSTDEHMSELNAAARRAGYIVTEQIESIIQRAEEQAEKIRRDAERDAEDVRREAVASAKRLLDRLHALEFPLGELVVSLRDEVDQVSRELEQRKHVESHATSLPPVADDPDAPSANEAEAAEAVDREPPAPEAPAQEHDVRTAEEASATDALAVEEPPNDRETVQATDVAEPEPAPARADDEPAPAKNGGKAGRRGRRGARAKQAKGPFITTEGHCAVCHRSFMAGSADELELSGWRVTGDVGLCPDCQAEGWQLPEGARLPVRPGGR